MQEQVARFFSDLIDVLVQNGIRELIGFLDGQMPQRLKRLLPVPWALFTQVVHDVQQPSKGLQMLLAGIHAAKVVPGGKNLP